MSLADDLRTERVQDDIHREQQLRDYADRNGTNTPRESSFETTGFVLFEFHQETAPLRQLPSQEMADRLAVICQPYLDRLERKGHNLRDAVDLLAFQFGVAR